MKAYDQTLSSGHSLVFSSLAHGLNRQWNGFNVMTMQPPEYNNQFKIYSFGGNVMIILSNAVVGTHVTSPFGCTNSSFTRVG